MEQMQVDEEGTEEIEVAIDQVKEEEVKELSEKQAQDYSESLSDSPEKKARQDQTIA